MRESMWLLASRKLLSTFSLTFSLGFYVFIYLLTYLLREGLTTLARLTLNSLHTQAALELWSSSLLGAGITGVYHHTKLILLIFDNNYPNKCDSIYHYHFDFYFPMITVLKNIKHIMKELKWETEIQWYPTVSNGQINQREFEKKYTGDLNNTIGQ
jgi:hypothetical protein